MDYLEDDNIIEIPLARFRRGNKAGSLTLNFGQELAEKIGLKPDIPIKITYNKKRSDICIKKL